MSNDWIERFLDLTDSIRSPRPFRLWAGIGTISAILERRVWTATDVKPLFPNTYLVLAGNPGAGKSIGVILARQMLAGIRGLTLGPDNPTDASFIDALYASAKPSVNGSGGIIHSAMAVLCREFGVLLPKYNDAFLATLADLYDTPPILSAPRRTSRSVVIEYPTVNILAAATPAALGHMPESAWGEGFASRVVFVYAPNIREYRDMFKPPRDNDLSQLKKQLETLYNEVHGELIWTNEARDAIRRWYNDEGQAPVPTYGRLTHYLSRRNEHLMKLAMISSVSAGHTGTVEESDFRRAQDWLFAAERVMPDVFRAMQQKSDVQLIEDAHHYFYSLYSKIARTDRQPLKERTVYGFFENKITSDQIPRLVDLMIKVGRLQKTQFGDYAVNPLPTTPTFD